MCMLVLAGNNDCPDKNDCLSLKGLSRASTMFIMPTKGEGKLGERWVRRHLGVSVELRGVYLNPWVIVKDLKVL